MKVRVPHRYRPRAYQRPFLAAMKERWDPKAESWLDEGVLRAVLIWHRRSGKDKSLLNFVIKQMFVRVGAYYYFFPTYKQGKKILWKGVDRAGMKFLDHFPPEVVAAKNETDMLIETVNGSIFQVIGTDKIDSIVGTNPVGCVFSEYALQDPQAWDLVRPILRENKGWAAFNFTPRGRNHGWSLYKMAKDNPEWFSSLLTVRDTCREDGSPVITDADIQAERDEDMPEELIQQEYFCSFDAGIQGAYYGQAMQRAEEEDCITGVPHEPSLPVDTWWDLGMDDSMSIWFSQTAGREVRLIDYYENNGYGLEHYAKHLQGLPYVYGTHYFPHDGKVRELGTGKSRIEVAEELGLRPIETVPMLPVNDGIDAARRILNRCWFDSKKCERGIDALKSYHKEWDEKKKVFKNKPLHDWSSHAADAFRMLGVGYRDKVKAPNGAGLGREFAVEGGWMGA